MSISSQISLFGEAKVVVTEPEPMTMVGVGSRAVRISLRKKRREAIKGPMEILADLERNDIYIGSYDAGERHFWLDNLKLPRLKLDFHPMRLRDAPKYIPGAMALWGSRNAQVRIFTDYLVAVREQEYQGYIHYLLDFCNGTWEYPIDNYRCHYTCLTITRFKD